jgi:predicted transcriptional regulator
VLSFQDTVASRGGESVVSIGFLQPFVGKLGFGSIGVVWGTGISLLQSIAVSVGVYRGKQRAMSEPSNSGNFIELAADIVSAYVSNNSVPVSDLPGLIGDVHAAILRVSGGHTPNSLAEAPKPAVSAKKSITNEFIICLEDGKKFKSLKRHLRTQYNMSPEEYREKWGLPPDYPMVAPAYAKARSQLAKDMGLGQQRRRRK